MKYKLISVLMMASLLVFSSCNDAIEINQPGDLDAQRAFVTPSDLNAGLLGAYDKFDYTPAIAFNSIFTDQLSIGISNGGQGLNSDYAFLLNPTSDISEAQWVNYYAALNATSRLIEASGNIEVSANEQAEFNNTLGQAYALRAWAHFELLTYFSTDLTDDSALGVILLNFVPAIDQQLGRNTNGEIYASISSDLAQATSLLAEQSNPTFVSKDFVTALQARIAAYRGDYATADGLAAQLLNSYPLANKSQYASMFKDQDNTEVIFKLERAIGDNYDGQGSTGSGFAGGWAGANFAFVNATITGAPYYQLSTDLTNLLNPSDVRFDVLIEPSSNLQAGTILVGKYRGTGPKPLLNDLKIFRSSEMLMIRAEAAANSNDLAGAAGFIDQLHDARFGSNQTTPSYASQADAFKAILTERRIEFAYEGFRWVDIKRLAAKAGMTTLERNAADCAVNNACSLSTDDPRFDALPIPLTELDANPTIKSQQNPGY